MHADHVSEPQKKVWIDPQLLRLGDDLADVTRVGDLSGLTEGAPGPGLLIYSS